MDLPSFTFPRTYFLCVMSHTSAESSTEGHVFQREVERNRDLAAWDVDVAAVDCTAVLIGFRADFY